MLDTVFDWFYGLYLHIGLSFGFIDDDPQLAGFKVTRLSFSPSSPAIVRVGDKIIAEQWLDFPIEFVG